MSELRTPPAPRPEEAVDAAEAVRLEAIQGRRIEARLRGATPEAVAVTVDLLQLQVSAEHNPKLGLVIFLIKKYCRGAHI